MNFRGFFFVSQILKIISFLQKGEDIVKKNKKDLKNEIISADNPDAELFDFNYKPDVKQSLAYLPALFTTASLPFRNVNKTVFVRKGTKGITLKLTSPINVPYGRYGRLLLSVLTTHAVINKGKGPGPGGPHGHAEAQGAGAGPSHLSPGG